MDRRLSYKKQDGTRELGAEGPVNKVVPQKNVVSVLDMPAQIPSAYRKEDGIAHSKEHYQEIGGIPTLFSTQMHIFAEDVLLRLGNEYKEFVQRKHALRVLKY